MFSRVLLVCCLGFQFSGMLSVQATIPCPTLHVLDDIADPNADTVYEGIFVIYNEGEYHERWANADAVKHCKNLYNRTDVEVTLLKNKESLLALASNEGVVCMDKSGKCNKYSNEGQCETRQEAMYQNCRAKCNMCGHSLESSSYVISLTKNGNDWTWEDGSTMDEDDDLWKETPHRAEKCAAWVAGGKNGNGEERGHIEGVPCDGKVLKAICHITGESPVKDEECICPGA